MPGPFLCAYKPKTKSGADICAGTTTNRIIAQTIGLDDLPPSMQLSVEDPDPASNSCGEGYSCTYTNSISRATPTQSLPMEPNRQVPTGNLLLSVLDRFDIHRDSTGDRTGRLENL